MIDSEWGFVHRMVQAHIAATHGDSMLIEVGVKGQGRADVIAPAIGAVWEIKHEGHSREGRCAEALAQATKYLYGTCTNGTVINTLGPAQALSGTFCIYITDTNFEVNYTTPQDGVVIYTVQETKKGKEAYAYAYAYVPHAEREKNESITVGLGAMVFVPVTPSYGYMGDPRQAYLIY